MRVLVLHTLPPQEAEDGRTPDEFDLDGAAQAIGEAIDQSGKIGAVAARRVAIEAELRRGKLLDTFRGQHQVLDAETGIDDYQSFGQKLGEMLRVAMRKR